MLVLALVATLRCADLCAPQALFWYGQLLRQGGYGRLLQEKAAFLIRERDGTLTLEPWANGGVLHASFRGSVPARAIAVIHTHPARRREPSAQDRQEARRLGMAVIVVTPDSVVAAMPDGSRLVPAEGRGWSMP